MRESRGNCVDSVPPRFCIFSFLRIPLDSMLLRFCVFDKGAPHGTFFFDFCSAKMAESIPIDSA